MNKLLVCLTFLLLVSCGGSQEPEDENDVLSKFHSTWNVHEKCVVNDDGSVTYEALPYSGLVGTFLQNNLPTDLSGYESITLGFAEPLPVAVQLCVSDRFKTWGKKGITSLTCSFDGQDVTSVDHIVLQATDTCLLTVTSAYLTPKEGRWESKTIWKGKCSFGNWENGFVVPGEQFLDANEGDKLEFLFTTDKSNPEVTYWLFKTIYSATETTLEGNDSELNEWGCAGIGEAATVYRIVLTYNDVVNLRDKGLFVNGYYAIVTQCNLVHKVYDAEEDEEEDEENWDYED